MRVMLKSVLKILVGNFFREGGAEHYVPLVGEGPVAAIPHECVSFVHDGGPQFYGKCRECGQSGAFARGVM